MPEQPVYITYSEDLRRALSRADVDLPALIRTELAKENIAGTVELRSDPTSPDAEHRDLFLLILAGGVAASVIGSAVARVIDAVTKQRRAAMVEHDLQAAVDMNGKPLFDKAGRPIYNASSKPAAMPAEGKEHTSFTAAKLLKYDFSRS